MNKQLYFPFLLALSFSLTAREVTVYQWTDEHGVQHFSQHAPQGVSFTTLKIRESDKVLARLTQMFDDNTATPAQDLVKHAKDTCDKAMKNLDILNQHQTIQVEEKGKKRLLKEKEIEQQKALAEKQIELYCAKAGIAQ